MTPIITQKMALKTLVKKFLAVSTRNKKALHNSSDINTPDFL